MPKKQTRESIEAELNASEHERLVLQLEEMAHDFSELDVELQRREKAQGLSEFNRTKPLPERMAALGFSKKAIEKVSDAIDAMLKMRAGRTDEISEDIRQKLAEGSDAKISALDQLQNILDARRSK